MFATIVKVKYICRLRERGMVAATRKGPAVEYRLTDMRLVNALDLLRAVLHDNLSHRAKLATHLE